MIFKILELPANVRQYLVVTGNYWAFTLTDGALRMLVVLHFHNLGYSPLSIAALFIFYELFGVFTNLIGGWLGAAIGLNKTMNFGLFLQVTALSLLAVPEPMLTIGLVMAAQALSGIAKDLNKMSAKSAIKTLVPENANTELFRWVAILTGSKNTLKGAGFFLGGLLLSFLGFRGALIAMAAALSIVWIISLVLLKNNLGKAKVKPKFSQLFSKSRAINLLSAARFFLFSARDIWFVIALPVYMSSDLNMDHWSIGAYFAAWIIGYGAIQAITPAVFAKIGISVPTPHILFIWSLTLAVIPAVIAGSLQFSPVTVLLLGLVIFGVVFAVNSSVHSYLIVNYASSDGVSLDVGFYYMANAAGRLAGTLLSGLIFQRFGIAACLWISAVLLILAVIITRMLPAGSERPS